MIASLSGTISATTLNSAVVEIGGFGILVNLSVPYAASLHVGQNVSLFTHLVVREDALTLYGFETHSGKEVFELLQRVSGIGPKVALSALSQYSPEQILTLISQGNNAALEKIPGLGKKGVARVVLELKDKVAPKTSSGDQLSDFVNVESKAELVSALVNLGYPPSLAQKNVDTWWDENVALQQEPLAVILKSLLQNLGRSIR